MTKSMLALLLIAGIISLAQVTAALGNETNGSRSASEPAHWSTASLKAFFAARRMDEVPWLDAWNAKTKSDAPVGPKLDLLEPLRLRFANPAMQIAGRN